MGTNWKKFFNLVAFVGLIAFGIAVLITAVAPSLMRAFLTIALILAIIVMAFYAFFYAYRGGRDSKGKWSNKQLILLCCWIAAVVLAFVGVILLNVL